MHVQDTSRFKQILEDLHHESPDIATLAARIALDIKPQVLATSNATLQAQLLDHLQAVATRKPGGVTHLSVWLEKVVHAGALSSQQATLYVIEADKVCYPTGGEPQ